MTSINTKDEYIKGRGQSIFNSYVDVLDHIKSLIRRDIYYNKKIDYAYYAKCNQKNNKWYIEWKIKNPNYNKEFIIEI
jgi:hypothetical protein